MSTLAPRPGTPAILAHGGVGSDPAFSDGCRAAVEAGFASLAATGDPLAAAVEAVACLEDDPRFNAGTGSIVRLDGSIQMDAAVMDSTGRFGAVGAIERVKNPVRVARAVLETPHLLLAGDGATAFARALGHADHDPGTPARRLAAEQIKEKIRRAAPDLPPFWLGSQWRAFWNYPLSPEALGLAAGEAGSDTVGAVVRASDGRFAAALSTGGSAIMLRGRVGDVPIPGAGLYTGSHGAVAGTGTGERIIEAMLANTLHGWLAGGVRAQPAAERAVALIGDRAPTGVIVVTPDELAAASSRPMAWAGREASGAWLPLSPG